MKKAVKILSIVLAVVMTVLCFASCGAKEGNDPSKNDASNANVSNASSEVGDLAYVKSKGTLVVGIIDFEPMDYQNENKEWIGFDADMAKAFAESLGVKAEFVEIDWDNKIFELKGKTIDCVWNGMTLTDEVKSSMSCSNAYCNNAQIVIVPKDKADQYQTAEACKELNFAVESGSAGKNVAEENGFKYTEVKDQATALTEVAAGTCDAAIIDSLMAAAMVGEGTGYSQLTYTVKLNSEEYGVGFRQGSDLTAKLNEFFAANSALMDSTAETYKVQAMLIK